MRALALFVLSALPSTSWAHGSHHRHHLDAHGHDALEHHPEAAQMESAELTGDLSEALRLRRAGSAIIDGANAGCDPGRVIARSPEVDAALGNRPTDWQAYLSQMSCTELFRDTPPSWANRVIPHGTSGEDWWWPACTYVLMNNTRIDHPDDSLAEAFNRTVDETRSLDLCARGSTAMRGGDGYVPQSQQAAGFRRMTRAQKRMVRLASARLRESVATQCCGSDQACLTFVRGTEIQFCQPPSGSGQADPCTDGAFYEQTDPGYAAMLDFLAGAAPEAQVPMTSGRIVLSPYLYPDGSAVDHVNTIVHELGHACSDARRRVLIKSGNDGERQDARMQMLGEYAAHNGSDCELRDAAKRTYKRLISSYGANSQSVECLTSIAARATTTRLAEPQRACAGGCPLAQLEEMAADYLQIMATPDTHFFSKVIPDMCWGNRDSEHPLMMDTFECYLKTPAIRARMERGVGCQR